MTYKSSITAWEHGKRTDVVFAVSDSYSGVFDLAGAPEVAVFSPGKSKKELDAAGGRFKQDTLQITVAPAAAVSLEDTQAIDFILAAADEAALRYVAIFIDPSPTPAPDEVEFAGVVQPRMSADDLAHSGEQWSSGIAPLRQWKLTAASFAVSVLDQITMEKIIYGGDGIAGILSDAAWIDANVADRSMAIHSRTGLWRVKSLVAGSALLQKIFSVAQEHLRSILFDPAFQLTLLPSQSSFTFQAMRPEENRTAYWGYTYENALQPLTIGDPLSADQPYFNWGLIDPEDAEREYSWLRYETLSDLLYALAHPFGCYLSFSSPNASTVRARYESRSDVEKAEFWIRDTIKGSLDTQPGRRRSSEQFYGRANQYAMDGPDHLIFLRPDEWRASRRIQEGERQEGIALPLTVSPTMQEYWNGFIIGVIPLNSWNPLGAYPDSDGKNPPTDIIHTGIYLNVAGQFRPAGRVYYSAAGVQVGRYSLSEAVNDIYLRDSAFFETTYKITVPELCGFSADPAGENPDWRPAVLGASCVLDGDAYTCVAVERDFERFETVITLHEASRFSFAAATLGGGDVILGGPGITGLYSEQDVLYLPAAEAGGEGDAVTILPAASVRRAKAESGDLGLVVGVALADFLATDTVPIRTAGRMTSESWSLTPGAPVYVRTAAAGAPNISSLLLTAKSQDEDAMIEIGRAVSANEIIIDHRREFAYE